jgi:biopolymer transport protein ExbD
MRRRFSERHSLHTLSELNVTPLLDLAFVLLIIFMITTPLMENSTDLVLPSSNAAAPNTNPDKVQTIGIKADGDLTLNGNPAVIGDIERQLTELRGSDAELAVLIRSHHEQSVQRFSDVLDAVRRTGVKRIGFASTPRD